MPRTLDPALAQVLQRANPNVERIVSLATPDVGLVLRRAADQFLLSTGSGGPRVSETPGGSTGSDAAGALSLATPGASLFSFPVSGGFVGLKKPDASSTLRGLQWLLTDPAFTAATLRTFKAQMVRFGSDTSTLKLSLQIYLPTVTPILARVPFNGTTPAGVISYEQISMVPLLASPVTITTDDITWSFFAAGPPALVQGQAVFDLTALGVAIDRAQLPGQGVSFVGGPGAPPIYLFVISADDTPKDNQLFWQIDTTTDAGTGGFISGIGQFDDMVWTRDDPAGIDLWQANPGGAWRPMCELDVEAYSATGQAVYSLDLGRAPVAASSGAVVFDRSVPAGTTATLELATAGSTGPWTGVSDGDAIATKQQHYWLRITLDADSTRRLTPRIAAAGVEFRTPIDVTPEGIVEPLAQAIDVPYLAASVGEGSLGVVRTGQRDYRDIGTQVATSSPVSKLECDIFMGSSHPLVPRSAWLQLERSLVTNRQPSGGVERFTTLSYLSSLLQNIPLRSETINQIVTVTASTTGAVTVAEALEGTLGSGNQYAGQEYYIRVRSSSQVGVETGYMQTIDGNTGVHELDFGPFSGQPLPGTFIAGDLIEVHSARYLQPSLQWIDQDPADIWQSILTDYCGIPLERLGRGDLGRAGRSGLPPQLADRAPGDATTQNKLRVTLGLQGAQNAKALIDQLSFLMGGATVEIAGQIVFRQIYPLRDPTGAVVIPPDPVAAVFDARTTVGLQTPVGLEARVTTLACDYGVDTTAVSKTTPAPSTTVLADADALAWLDAQDILPLADAAISSDIARWCYNSHDAGAYLATQLTQQVVRVASTGLRVWSWGDTEPKPELVIGDRVVVITDQYTDYDPAAQQPISGLTAFPLVIISIEQGGAQLKGLVPGLTDAVEIRGGPGNLTPVTFDTSLRVGYTVLPPSTTAEAGVFERFQVNAGDPLGGTPTVKIISLTASTSIALGPAVGVASANGTTWMIEQPAAGKGPGAVIIEADSGGRSVQLTIPIPEKTSLTGAQGTVSIDSNGITDVSWDGGSIYQAYRYAFNTGVGAAFPNDSTTGSSGTLVNTAGPITLLAIATLGFGDGFAMTIVPFTGAGPSGNEGPAIHLRGAFTSFSGNKTATYSANGFTLISDPGYQGMALTDGTAAGWTPAGGLGVFYPAPGQPALPYVVRAKSFFPQAEGCTLTGVSFDYYGAPAGTPLGALSVGYEDSSGVDTFLGNTIPSSIGAWNTYPVAVSDSTSGRKYFVEVPFQDVFASGSAPGSNRISGFTVSWAMPAPLNAL